MEWWPDGGDALETLPVLLGIIISFAKHDEKASCWNDDSRSSSMSIEDRGTIALMMSREVGEMALR
jgi:hypothetical protein